MLAAGQRLRRRGEFAAATRSGRRAARGTLVVYLNPPAAARSEDQSPARVGFIVGKAVGHAVDRNRVRRRLRHLIRDRLRDLPPGAGVVVRALPGAATRPYRRLGADLDAALAALTRQRRARAASSSQEPERQP